MSYFFMILPNTKTVFYTLFVDLNPQNLTAVLQLGFLMTLGKQNIYSCSIHTFGKMS